MSAKMGRPVEFDSAKQETFCALVGVGLSRRQAADYLGIAASTATRSAERDEAFADALRQAEMKCHLELMERLRRQCERSWRACVWLLEHTYPQLYAPHGKASPQQGLSTDQLFDQFVTLLDEEVGDEALRARLTGRLDQLATQEFRTQQEAEVASSEPRCDERSAVQAGAERDAGCRMLDSGVGVAQPVAQGNAPRVSASQPQRLVDPRRERRQRRKLQRRQQAARVTRGADTIDRLLAAAAANRPDLDFCNTSTSPQERRLLESVCA